MSVFTKYITLNTEPDKIYDITEEVRNIINESKLNNGIALIFVPGSTAAITTIEYENGALKDFKDALARIAPENINYE
ncbi:MAG: YjbQ family protein, partial [Candidatus Altarchaeaceae archaeon]